MGTNSHQSSAMDLSTSLTEFDLPEEIVLRLAEHNILFAGQFTDMERRNLQNLAAFLGLEPEEVRKYAQAIDNRIKPSSTSVKVPAPKVYPTGYAVDQSKVMTLLEQRLK